MANSVASSRVGRKYNIAPELCNSPYLSKPTASPYLTKPGSFQEKQRGKNHHGGSPGEASKRSKSTTRRRRGERDAEIVASFRTHRTSMSSYRRPSQGSAQRMTSMKKFLLPREMDKLLRGFRQKNANHPISKGQSAEEEEYEDDTSTIASDFAEPIEDRAVYLHFRKCGDEVMKSLFSGPLFAEITWRNCNKEVTGEPVLTLPSVGISDHDKCDVSDLESLPSVERRQPKNSRRKRF